MPKKPKLSYEGELILRPLIPQINALSEGASMPVNAPTPEQLLKAREQIYRYFKLTEQGKLFKITVLSPTKLLVIRRLTYAGITIGNTEPLKNPKITETLESILDLTEPEAMAEVRKAVEANHLTDSEALSVMEEYTQVMST